MVGIGDVVFGVFGTETIVFTVFALRELSTLGFAKGVGDLVID